MEIGYRKIRAPRSKQAGSGSLVGFSFVCLLLGAPLTAVGGYFFFKIAAHITEYQRAQSWVPTPAVLNHIELTPTRNRKTGKKMGDLLRVSYSYKFGGQSYASSRVALSTEKFQGDSFDVDLYNSLISQKRKSGVVTCFVDPSKPAKAVLNREIRTALVVAAGVFILIFGGIGLGLLSAPFLVSRQQRELDEVSDGSVWHIRKDWAAGYIDHNSSNKAYFLLFFSFIFMLAALPVFILNAPKELAAGRYGVLALLIFIAAGFAMGIDGLRHYFISRKFRSARLVPSIMPIARGVENSLTLELDVFLPPEITIVEADISCLLIKRRRKGGGSAKKTRVIYEEVILGRVGEAPHGSIVTFPVLVPQGYPKITLDYRCRERVEWKFWTEAVLPGTDLELEFDLPVFDEQETEADLDVDS